MGNDRATIEASGAHRGSFRRSLVLLIMSVGYFLVLLDVTIINVTLPSIHSALGRR